MARPPSSASLPCGSRSRNWTNAAPRRLLLSRRPVPSALLRRSLKALARFVHAWSKSSSPGGRPPIGGACIAKPSNARPNSKPRSTGFRRCFAGASSNSSAERPRPGRHRTDRPARGPRHAAAPPQARSAARSEGAQAARSFPPPGCDRGPPTPPGAMLLFALWPALRRLPGHRGCDPPRGRCPGPSPGRPPSPLSADLLVCRPSRHRRRPAAAPADPQEHPGSFDLGGPAPG